MNANINYIETVSPLLYLYLHNCTQPQEKKEMYQLQCVFVGVFTRRNYIAFLYTHFASDFASDLGLAEEIVESSFVASIIVLLDRMNTTLEPETLQYSEHMINDEDVDIVGQMGGRDA